jgi:hypothetical protein
VIILMKTRRSSMDRGEAKLDVQWTAADLAFRDVVRAFLAETPASALKRVGARMASVHAPTSIARAWRALWHARGGSAPALPAVHGRCEPALSQPFHLRARTGSVQGAADAPDAHGGAPVRP